MWRPSNKVGRLDGDGSVFVRAGFDSIVFDLTRGVMLESAKVRRVSVGKVKSMSFHPATGEVGESKPGR